MSDHFSRRNFVKASAAVASAAMPALGQSNEVTVGVIGAGGRGYYLTERLYVGNRKVKVLSVCDTYQGNLNRIKDRIQTMGKNTPEATADYTKVLSNRDVQMVIIATPEHLHHRMTLDAIAAGKHIYVEKPLAHTIEEGEEILKAAQAAKVKIQVGTQNRSNSLYGMAKQMIAQGLIGDCHYVRAFWYRNALPGGAPAWRYTVPKDASPENTDWQRFLGAAPKREFDKQRYYQWRLYWDYSGGISTDLLVHQTDITNFVLGKTTPDTCVASGGVYRWTDANDDREVPDTMSAIYEYGDKFHLNYSCYFGNDNFGYGEQFCGNEGTVEVLNRSMLRFTPQKFAGQPFAGRKDAVVELLGNDNLAVEAHIRNLVEAIQGRAQLIAPVEVGQQAAISGHMATLALRNKKMVRWDARSRKTIIG
ncbi:MAG: Gfo/Idh/MocA family oxidoreductase [Bryobacterales bacterium]|nr:Gfo/Idh/MocA family oxidoreductase [Bryobacterales bacterium]